MQVTITTHITTSDGDTYCVSVTYDQDANMPENADLSVRELADDEKEDYVNQSAEALEMAADDFAFARAFDISLLDPVTGAELEPASGVKVSVSLLDIDLNSIEELRLLHFGEEVETVSYTLNGSAVEFETDGFSVYVLTGYTVDFHWGDYTYSIAGESEITLSALLEKLGVTEITAADVAEVAFSDPALVEVEAIKNEAEQTTDWLLKSLAPFSTDEKLTLTLKNGKSVEIKVTDATIVAQGNWSFDGKNNNKPLQTGDVELTSGSGTWTLDADGVLTISGNGMLGNYEQRYNNSYWATNKNNIKSVIIGEGITGLGNRIFNEYPNLESVKLPSTLLTLTSRAFQDAKKLSSVDFTGCSNLVNLGRMYAFAGTNLSTIINFQDCKDSLKSIAQYSFYQTKIEGIDLSDFSVLESIGENAFGSCSSLTSVDLSNCVSLTSINNKAFNSSTALTTFNLSGCTSLTSVTVPNSVKELNVSGSGLTSLTVPSGVTTLDVSDTSLTSLTVPTGITNLDVSGSGITSLDLSKCTKLTSLDVSDTGITSLDLSKCTNLTSLDVSGTGITSLDVSKCTSLASLDVSDCTDLANLNISGCTDLTSLTVPSGVTTLNASGSGLTSLDLSASTGLTSLDTSGCAGLTSLDVPNTVTTLNVSGCTALTSLNVPSGVATLNASGSGLTSLDLSAATNLNSLDISGCTGLNSLTVPDTVTTLNVSDCTGLSSLSVPSSVTTLDVSNSGLTSLDLSASTGLTSLNTSGCTGLTSLNLSACTNLTNDKLTISNSVKELDISGTTLSPNITSLKDSLETLTMSLSNTGEADLSGFTALTTIYFDGTESEWDEMGFTVRDEVDIILKDVPKIPLTIKVGNVSKTYDGNGTVDMDAGGIYTAEGLSEGHAIESLTLTLTDETFGVGDHVLSASDARVVDSSGHNVTGRYEISYEPGTLTITHAHATVTAINASKVYGEDDPAFTARVNGLVNGEEADLIQYDFKREEGEDTGTYAITPVGDVTQGNYTVSFAQGTMTITRTLATVTAVAKFKTYSESDPTLTATVSGLKRGDTEDVLTYTLSRAAGENAGSYTITPSGADVQGNYHVVFRTGALTIEPASVTVKAGDAEKVYGEVDPQFTATVTGLLNGESEDLIDYAFDRTQGENVGKYNIIPVAQEVQRNYRVVCINGELNIKPAAATVTADDKEKTYGETDPALTAVVSGLKRGDAASVISYTLSRAAGENAGSYAITPAGETDQGNYVVTYVPGTLTVNQAEVTVTADDKTKGYGDDDPELTATVTGLAEGDTIDYHLSRETGENMGSYAISLDSYTITRAGEAVQDNYDVTCVPSTLTITKRPVTVTGIKAKEKTYDGTTAAELDFSEVQLAGLLEGDTLTVTANGAFENANAGEDKIVTLSGLTLAGDHLENYELAATGQQETAAATIKRAEVTVTAENKTKVYGEADPKLTAAVEGTLGEDSVTYTLSRAAGRDVGEYAITPEGEAEQGNYHVTYR